MTSPLRMVCSSATSVSAIVCPSSAGANVMRWPGATASSAERRVTVPAGGAATSAVLFTTSGSGALPSLPPSPPPPQAPSSPSANSPSHRTGVRMA